MRQYFTESDANYQIGEALYIYASMKEGGAQNFDQIFKFHNIKALIMQLIFILIL